MTGPEHYREAERLLLHTDQSVTDQFGDGAECARQQLAAAQVHATLAAAAASVAILVEAYVGEGSQGRKWAETAS